MIMKSLIQTDRGNQIFDFQNTTTIFEIIVLYPLRKELKILLLNTNAQRLSKQKGKMSVRFFVISRFFDFKLLLLIILNNYSQNGIVF